MSIAEALYKFQSQNNYPLTFKRGDYGIFTLDRDTPCFAEVLSFHSRNTYPTVDLQVLKPVAQRSTRITPNGLEDITIWMLAPTQMQAVQICYPDVKFEKIPMNLAIPQSGDGFLQTMTDDWLPTNVTNTPRIQGIETSNIGKFFPTSAYNFKLHLKRYEFKDQFTKTPVKAIEKIYPSAVGYYPSYAICFQDFFDAKYAHPEKFISFGERLNEDNRWDLVELQITYKDAPKSTSTDIAQDFYFGATNQETTLPVDLTELPQGARIIRSGQWWTNERMSEIMSFISNRDDVQVIDIK